MRAVLRQPLREGLPKPGRRTCDDCDLVVMARRHVRSAIW
jgi:hypothetical protein